MKKSILLVAFFAFALGLCAQQPVVEWAKTYGGSNVEYPADIILTSDNKYVIAGSTNSKDFDVTQNRGGEDVWVVKLDEDGKILWQKTYGGTGNEGATAIKQTTDGGFMLLGVTRSKDGDFIATKGDLDIFLSKLDSLGNIIWTKIYGGSKKDYAGTFFETTTSEFVIGISTRSNDLDFPENEGENDIWVLKTTAKGDIIWKKHFGGSLSDFASEVIQVENNNYLLVGETSSTDKDMISHTDSLLGKGDLWIKLDTSGNLIWHKSYGFHPYGFFAAIVSVKTDSIGYIGVGSAENSGNYKVGHYAYEMFVIRLDKEGKLLWRKLLGGSKLDYASDIEILADGSFAILGSTESSMTGDVSISYGLRDYWVVRLDSKGENILWEIALGGSGFDECLSSGLIVTKDNKLIVVGETESSNRTFSRINGPYDWGVVKLKNIGITTAIFDKTSTYKITIYPNPVSDILYIQANENLSLDYQLIDLQGKTVKNGAISSGDSTINLQGISKGMYIITFLENHVLVASTKVVVHE
jgi:hypothetical protein